jgi:coenzyme F420-reducing hydrogenase beta subunit
MSDMEGGVYNVAQYAESECCGCGACSNLCPKDAIRMCENDRGFVYPRVDEAKCIRCGLCLKACNYQNGTLGPGAAVVYAAASKDDAALKRSASGGVFCAIASRCLQCGGKVYGCSMETENGRLTPRHICVEDEKDLYKLQGSKYVRSDIGQTYSQVKEDLKNYRQVLFSGTPCQVDGLYGYLGYRNDPNLYTIDIVCHGVPSRKMFQDYVSFMESKLKGTVDQFVFRDKSGKGWGYEAKIVYHRADGHFREKRQSYYFSSYYALFLDTLIFRENCYTCKYAGRDRVGNLTIGDYWGLKQEHPEYLVENGGKFTLSKGVSCILVNNEKGGKMLSRCGGDLILEPSTFERAARGNRQLRAPSPRSDRRETILRIYAGEGYPAVDRYYIRSLGVRYYVRRLKTAIRSARRGGRGR